MILAVYFGEILRTVGGMTHLMLLLLLLVIHDVTVIVEIVVYWRI